MAKRFFNTARIDEDWYIDLSLKHRELLRYCESKCDGAGVFPFNPKIASTYIGEKVSEADLKMIGAEKLPNGKFWLPEFISEQNSELSETCPAHKPIFKSIKENQITLSNRVSSRVCNTLQEIDIVIEKETVTEKEEEIVKESKTKNEISLPFDSEVFRSAWAAWKEYKAKDKKFAYKSAISEQVALKRLVEHSGNNEKIALEIIETSIGNGWSGLFELKLNGHEKRDHRREPNAHSETFGKL